SSQTTSRFHTCGRTGKCGRGEKKCALVANACESRGTLRFAPNREVITCPCSDGLEPASLHRVMDQLGTAAQPEFFNRTGLMDFDGLDAQIQSVGDLAINVAVREQFDHLSFALGELRFPMSLTRRGADKARDDLRCQHAIDTDAARGNLADGSNQ